MTRAPQEFQISRYHKLRTVNKIYQLLSYTTILAACNPPFACRANDDIGDLCQFRNQTLAFEAMSTLVPYLGCLWLSLQPGQGRRGREDLLAGAATIRERDLVKTTWVRLQLIDIDSSQERIAKNVSHRPQENDLAGDKLNLNWIHGDPGIRQ